MGLTESLNEFTSFLQSLDEMKQKLEAFLNMVRLAVEKRLVNPNVPSKEICIEGYVLDINSIRLYLKVGMSDRDKKDNVSNTMDAEEILKLYKLLPRFMEAFFQLTIDNSQKEIDERLKRFEAFVFEHSV